MEFGGLPARLRCHPCRLARTSPECRRRRSAPEHKCRKQLSDNCARTRGPTSAGRRQRACSDRRRRGSRCRLGHNRSTRGRTSRACTPRCSRMLRALARGRSDSSHRRREWAERRPSSPVSSRSRPRRSPCRPCRSCRSCRPWPTFRPRLRHRCRRLASTRRRNRPWLPPRREHREHRAPTPSRAHVCRSKPPHHQECQLSRVPPNGPQEAGGSANARLRAARPGASRAPPALG